MPVVSNTSPILNLAVIGRLDLLRLQFEQVLIPEAVRAELRIGDSLPGNEFIQEALEAGWLRVNAVRNEPLRRTLARDLDEGEAEAIVLAIETSAERVLLDEREGRICAKRLGLAVTGVLGILLRGKLDGSLPSLRDATDRLRREAGFHLHDDLIRTLLREGGEGADT